MTTEASLICVNCGHTREHHPENTGCHFVTRISGGSVRCPCTRFKFDPETVPEFNTTTDYEPLDEVALEAAQVVARLDSGRFDPYLEIILSAGHQRKLALRGVRGFPRNDRH